MGRVATSEPATAVGWFYWPDAKAWWRPECSATLGAEQRSGGRPALDERQHAALCRRRDGYLAVAEASTGGMSREASHFFAAAAALGAPLTAIVDAVAVGGVSPHRIARFMEQREGRPWRVETVTAMSRLAADHLAHISDTFGPERSA